jgi:DNA polymerase-3 subunit epsilon
MVVKLGGGMRQIVLDTETTGLEPEQGHRIIEIGCIELINRKFTGKRYHQYINPEREVEEGALQVHGITNQFLKDKPVFATVVKEFMDFISGAELIIHNAPFDTAFINHELKLTKQNWNTIAHYCHVVDSLVIARQLHIGQRNSLDALCKRYSVDNSNRELHGALMDAHLLAQVYLAMTGGQGSLFDESQLDKAKNDAGDEAIIKQSARNLIVLQATAEELKEHEQYLQKMKGKGACIWVS